MIPVCKVGDVPPGEGRSVTVLDRRIAIFHAESGWYALDDRCPHRGGPLSDGVLAERSVICPLHERRFDLADGEPIGPGCPVTAHSVIVAGEDVFVELTERIAGPTPVGSSGPTRRRDAGDDGGRDEDRRWGRSDRGDRVAARVR